MRRIEDIRQASTAAWASVSTHADVGVYLVTGGAAAASPHPIVVADAVVRIERRAES